jgi:hypothetical protein
MKPTWCNETTRIYGCHKETATEQLQMQGISPKTVGRESWNIKTMRAVGRKIGTYSSYIL